MSDQGGAAPLINGSCLCGAVKYTLAGGYAMTVLCHCDSCRKFTGSSFGANSLVDKKNLTVLDPQKKMQIYRAATAESGGSLARSFCSVCGSSLFVASEKNPGQVAVTSGTMDNAQGVEGVEGKLWTPQLEVYCKRKAKWYTNEGTHQMYMM